MRGSNVAAAAVRLRADASDLLALAVLAVSLPGLYVCAWFGWAVPFVVVLALSVLADWRGERRTPKLFEVLRTSRLGPVERQLARDTALILLLWRTGALPLRTVALLSLGSVAVYLVLGAFLLARQYLGRIRTLPIETRNVDLSALRIPDAPRPAFLRRDGWLVVTWIFTTVGMLAAQLSGQSAYGYVGVGVALVASVVACATLARALWRARHLRRRSWVFATTLAGLAELAPQVVLYHSGAPGSLYQVDMWLSTMDAVDAAGSPVLILLRQPEHLAALAPTRLPVACVASASDVMDLTLPSLRLALYVGNVGENMHLLRNGGLDHVFIGHGDSDKAASANRVSRVFDEVWVAGPAGRERYRDSDAAVADESIVEVGRPQLRGISPARLGGDGRLTVLYAPTWEGWSDDMYLTSVPDLGRALIAALIADPNIRVIYRPHPLAGTRSPTVRHAHAGIVRLLGGASPAVAEKTMRRARAGADAASARAGVDGASARAGANAASAKAGVNAASARAGADAAEAARDGRLDPAAMAGLAQAQAAREQRFWEGRAGRHAVVTAAGPSLYSCFNQADVLITDVSSLISEFIASDKPYVVTNPAGLADDTFTARYPAATGGYRLRTIGELAQILRDVRGPDPLAGTRARLRQHLLGPAGPEAPQRFVAAVQAAVRRRAEVLPAPRREAPGTVPSKAAYSGET
jgi:hypothetical protein